ncbi:MAG: SPASM domain-containing protein, partial [Candidatus Omnitrophota bacterium]
SCDIIEVSIDAFHKNTYENIRVGGDFDLVIRNTLKLIELRNSLNKDVKIMVSIIDQSEVKDEMNDFKKHWHNKADKVLIRKLTSIGGLVENKIKKNTQASFESRWPCPLLWRRMFINVDGLAEFCVDDWLDESVIGDVRKESLKDIWQGQAYQQLRQMHLNQEFIRNRKCALCADWQARTWDYDYFSALEAIGIKTG